MRKLIAGQNPVPVTQEEADEVIAWCEGRVGWVPLQPTSLSQRWPVNELRKAPGFR